LIYLTENSESGMAELSGGIARNILQWYFRQYLRCSPVDGSLGFWPIQLVLELSLVFFGCGVIALYPAEVRNVSPMATLRPETADFYNS